MASVVVAVALTAVAARAVAADARELKAREEFAAGRYQEALDLFAKLYAESLHPIFLRNIGRCYQNLGDPDKAVISFRDYLRKHKTIQPDERAEIEGFIVEMEALKSRREAEALREARTGAAASTITPVPPAPQPSSAPEALVAAPSAHPSDESSPVYTRWWFWTLAGAVAVGAAAGIAAATGAFTTTRDGVCLDGFLCQ
jgi:tetratricopeptide (TPR) repeat protein